MAQIVWAVAGSRPAGPKFFLLNANGPTMLRRAVRYAIEKQVDIILFSGSFEGGGNGDGKGPIDRIVYEAVDRGILWVNAGGQLRRPGLQRAGPGPLRRLPPAPRRARRRRPPVPQPGRREHRHHHPDLERLRDEEDAGTDKDLDLFVEDWTGRRVGSGEKVQVSGDRVAGPDESRNPRERVVLADLAANPHVPTDPDYLLPDPGPGPARAVLGRRPDPDPADREPGTPTSRPAASAPRRP